MENTKKSIGIGSISIVLAITGVIWAFSLNGFCLGDVVLSSIGLKSWSGGSHNTHYTVFYSLIFFVAAFFISTKYPDCYFSKIGKIVSLVSTILIILLIFEIQFN